MISQGFRVRSPIGAQQRLECLWSEKKKHMHFQKIKDHVKGRTTPEQRAGAFGVTRRVYENN